MLIIGKNDLINNKNACQKARGVLKIKNGIKTIVQSNKT